MPLTDTTTAGGTILLAEDDASVRAIVCRVLTSHGFQVLEASSADEAVALWHSHGGTDGRIDLLVTDVVMPGHSGRELVGELRALRPTLPVLYTSGYLEESPEADPNGAATDYLEKPFATAKLLHAVRQLLATRDR
jgi:two-component system cell cycle sensor histidine kinase/response regulator CckA